MAKFKAGDRIRLLVAYQPHNQHMVGSLGTLIKELDTEGVYEVQWDVVTLKHGVRWTVQAKQICRAELGSKEDMEALYG